MTKLFSVPKRDGRSASRTIVDIETRVQDSARISKLIDNSMKLQYEEPKDNLGCLPPFFVQFSLPHLNPKTKILEGKNPNYEISLLSPNGLPYGYFPRIFLAYLCREIAVYGSTVVSLGTSQAELLKLLGLHEGGAYCKKLKEQSKRLLTTSISIQRTSNINDVTEEWCFLNCPIVKGGKFTFIKPKESSKEPTWSGEIELSSDFVQLVNKGLIPFSLTGLSMLRKSTLAMDIYVWLCYRVYLLDRLQGHSRTAYIPFDRLQEQFMPFANSEPRYFRKRFLKRLDEVFLLWPQARKLCRITEDHNSLVVKAGKPHVDPEK